MKSKAPFIATQLNSTGRPVELSCVALNGALVQHCYLAPRCQVSRFHPVHSSYCPTVTVVELSARPFLSAPFWHNTDVQTLLTRALCE